MKQALNGADEAKLGAAKIIPTKLIDPAHRHWAQKALVELFHDPSSTVRTAAAHCFWHLWTNPEKFYPKDHEEFIQAFLDSPSFVDDPSFLIHAITEAQQCVPEAALRVCAYFIKKCGAEAADFSTSTAGDGMNVVRLVFSAYTQMKTEDLRLQALGLIDELCLLAIGEADNELNQHDR